MSAGDYSYGIQPGAAASHLITELAWSALMLPLVLFAWHQSHFQYDIYMPGDFGLMIYRLSVAAVLVLIATSSISNYKKQLVYMVLGYIVLAALHAVLDQILTAEGKLPYFLQAMAFSVMMLPIISDKRMLRRFIRVNFLLGMMLITLSTIPLLHWLDVLSLPYAQITRFAGETTRPDLDPLYFGLFGLTESYVPIGNPLGVARLQGFSFEPLHWAYFVFLTLASGLFLLAASNKKSRGIGVGALLMFALIAFHFFFIFSMSAFLAAAACFGSIGYFFVSRRNHRNRKKEALYGLILLVVTPGILIPFAIAQIPDIGFYLVAEDVLNKGSNWDDKIGFLALGSSLYTRFVPTFGDIPAASHNLVLSTYLKYGYILSLPLIGYCWALMKNAFAGLPFAILAGTAITILAHMLVVPPQFFYPSGAMWILMAVGVAFHARRTESNRAVIPSASVTPLRGKVEPSR